MAGKDKSGKEEIKRELKVEIALLIKKIEALTKRLVQTRTMGEYVSVFRGAGLEFDGYKEYSTDMDASTIDWKASIRVRQLLVKKYREIRDLQVYFVMDVSESMVFGSTDKLKNEYAVEFILSLAYTILGAGDSVGLVTFSDNIMTKFKAAKGTNQFYKMAKVLIDPTLYGGGYNLEIAEEFILNFVARKNSVVIIVSDFYGMQGNLWKKRLKLLSAKFDVICLVVRDPRDKFMIDEVRNVIMEDPYTGERLLVDSAYIKERYESFTRKQDKELFALFKDANVDAVELPTDQLLLSVLTDFFKVRRKRI